MSRNPVHLMHAALRAIDAARKVGGPVIPLFSGGHDSTCACHIASKHPTWRGAVHHIDTGIGAAATRRHVEAVCEELGWDLKVYRSPNDYQRYVRLNGFPGPGAHSLVYAHLKERCVRMMTRAAGLGRHGKAYLVTGARAAESTRRMGAVAPYQVGEYVTRRVRVVERRVWVNRNRVWVSPCHDWTTGEQVAYMRYFGLPENPVKIALGMSGECFCGAFAAPGELDRIRHHCPDVAAEIDRLAGVARAAGKPCVWGTRPTGQTGIVAAKAGPLCSGCDMRAAAAGIAIER